MFYLAAEIFQGILPDGVRTRIDGARSVPFVLVTRWFSIALATFFPVDTTEFCIRVSVGLRLDGSSQFWFQHVVTNINLVILF